MITSWIWEINASLRIGLNGWMISRSACSIDYFRCLLNFHGAKMTAINSNCSFLLFQFADDWIFNSDFAQKFIIISCKWDVCAHPLGFFKWPQMRSGNKRHFSAHAQKYTVQVEKLKDKRWEKEKRMAWNAQKSEQITLLSSDVGSVICTHMSNWTRHSCASILAFPLRYQLLHASPINSWYSRLCWQRNFFFNFKSCQLRPETWE